jgi:hypothetical protein
MIIDTKPPDPENCEILSTWTGDNYFVWDQVTGVRYDIEVPTDWPNNNFSYAVKWFQENIGQYYGRKTCKRPWRPKRPPASMRGMQATLGLR